MLKNLMKKPMAKDLAADELEQAEKSLLQAQAASEYAQAMCQYHEKRIQRLRAYLEVVQQPMPAVAIEV